ncbi:MAG TPA: hypothetical protein VMF50_11615 [Candidatus Binataceae bacterium]|nr:hypothetical protein [Candidatus Binataceae bacterium]
MRRSRRLLKLAGLLVLLFAVGIGFGAGYEWYRGSLIPSQIFVTAGDNEAQSASPPAPASGTGQPAASLVLPEPNPAAPVRPPAPQLPKPAAQLPKPIPPSSGNVVVLNPVKPAAPSSPPSTANELTLSRAQPPASADRLPVIGSGGQTIWVPRAIEGCWAGSGGSSIQYLGGCPNLASGANTPVRLRWCFRRVGNQPLTLIMARGKYPGRVSQRWNVTGAHGQTINLQETISYNTMMFLHVVDVGEWTCSITRGDELVCSEHELARCGPAPWLRAPWFRGSGWVTARRTSG